MKTPEQIAAEIVPRGLHDSQLLIDVTEGVRLAQQQARREALQDAATAQCAGCGDGRPSNAEPKNVVPPSHGSLACSATRILALIDREEKTMKAEK